MEENNDPQETTAYQSSCPPPQPPKVPQSTWERFEAFLAPELSRLDHFFTLRKADRGDFAKAIAALIGLHKATWLLLRGVLAHLDVLLASNSQKDIIVATILQLLEDEGIITTEKIQAASEKVRQRALEQLAPRKEEEAKDANGQPEEESKGESLKEKVLYN